MLKRRQKRRIRRETRDLTYDVFDDFKKEGISFTKKDVRDEVFARRERTAALFDNLPDETRNAIRDFFAKVLDLLLDRLFSQLG